MSHFVCYTHRLEKAGIFSLWISLGADKDGYRLMHVSPDATVPRELAAKYPTRTFLITGDDPILRELEDELAYNNGTNVMAANMMVKHPLQAADLAEWWADWQAHEVLTDADIDDAADVDEAAIASTQCYVKGLLKGFDAHKTRMLSKTNKGEHP